MERSSFRMYLAIALAAGITSLSVFLSLRSQRTLVDDITLLTATRNREVWEYAYALKTDGVVRAVIDYTYWDDMVKFARNEAGASWAEENLIPGIESFGIDALWVVRADGTLQYSAARQTNDINQAPEFPLSLPAIQQLLTSSNARNGVVHSFAWFSDIGPLLVYGASITTTDDPEHAKPAQGYYFVAARLSEGGIFSGLEPLGMEVTATPLASIPTEVFPTASNPHTFWQPLRDASGSLIGALRVHRTQPSVTRLIQWSQQSIYTLVIVWALVFLASAALIVALSRTRQRATELASQISNSLRESNTVLERRVDERTQELAQDIQRRRAFEEQLERRTRELESMNRAMLDRESRILELKHQIEVLEKQH